MTNQELTQIWDECAQGRCKPGWGCNEQATMQTLHNRETNTSWYREPPETRWRIMEKPGQAG